MTEPTEAIEIEVGGDKAKVQDDLIKYLKNLWRAGKVGKGVARLDQAQRKCLLNKVELQALSKWCEEHPHG